MESSCSTLMFMRFRGSHCEVHYDNHMGDMRRSLLGRIEWWQTGINTKSSHGGFSINYLQAIAILHRVFGAVFPDSYFHNKTWDRRDHVDRHFVWGINQMDFVCPNIPKLLLLEPTRVPWTSIQRSHWIARFQCQRKAPWYPGKNTKLLGVDVRANWEQQASKVTKGNNWSRNSRPRSYAT